jgi:transcriptional regulator GlxA family with amidase domain
MFGGDPKSLPERFGMVLMPRFPLMAFTSVVEPMRAANRLSHRSLYAWELVSRDGGPVTASSGVQIIPDQGIETADGYASVVVCSGFDAERCEDKSLFAWLRRQARRGANVGAVSTGTYILARAGLLDDYRCTIHWENLAGFREAFPHLDATHELFEIDRDRVTCSGGTAALDMMLSMITMQHGRDLAVAVAEQFIHERIRDMGAPQRMSLRARLGVSHPRLLSIVSMMEENLEEPLSRADLAARAGLSTRQLERLFRKYLARTPTRYYLELRLDRARQLLVQTSLSVLDVALACGFVSASHFSKCYREYYQRTPREERRTTLAERRFR